MYLSHTHFEPIKLSFFQQVNSFALLPTNFTMSFSLANHVAFTDGIYFKDFIHKQAVKRREIIYKARIGFITDVRRYFRSVHLISEL